jgi:hypothetical protein
VPVTAGTPQDRRNRRPGPTGGRGPGPPLPRVEKPFQAVEDHVEADDGELGPGDVFAIAPGHDAEVVGDEPCVMIDLGEQDADYAKPAY